MRDQINIEKRFSDGALFSLPKSECEWVKSGNMEAKPYKIYVNMAVIRGVTKVSKSVLKLKDSNLRKTP